MRVKMGIIITGVLILASTACTTHRVRVDPVEVKPIHVTMDINLRVQKELESFFDFEDEVPAEAPVNEQQPPKDHQPELNE